MPVPFLDLKRQYATIRSEIEPVILDLCASQQFILGPPVEAFEKAAAQWIGVPHAVTCATGSDALLLCLMAHGVGPGDEVVTTPFTFFATAGTIWRLGARPVFADIEPDTFNLSPKQAARAVTNKTKAILPVHLYGQCADTGALGVLAASRGIPLIEDACQAIGAAREGRQAGALGASAAFSFYPTKNLGGFGEGGLVTTASDEIAARVRLLRVHGMRDRYHHDVVGLNSRLDALKCAVLHKKLAHLRAWNARRRAIAALYDRLLVHPEIVTPAARPENFHVYHQYVIRVRNGKRDAVMARLKDAGIGCFIFYPVPLHLQPCFASLGYKPGDLPESERAAAEVLALPVFAELTDDEVREVAAAVLAAL